MVDSCQLPPCARRRCRCTCLSSGPGARAASGRPSSPGCPTRCTVMLRHAASLLRSARCMLSLVMARLPPGSAECRRTCQAKVLVHLASCHGSVDKHWLRLQSPALHAPQSQPALTTHFLRPGIMTFQAEHPLLWSPERSAWLTGSPMARTLADRLQQVQEVRGQRKCSTETPSADSDSMMSQCTPP